MLPVELWLSIAEILPRPSLISLSSTSTSFRALFCDQIFSKLELVPFKSPAPWRIRPSARPDLYELANALPAALIREFSLRITLRVRNLRDISCEEPLGWIAIRDMIPRMKNLQRLTLAVPHITGVNLHVLGLQNLHGLEELVLRKGWLNVPDAPKIPSEKIRVKKLTIARPTLAPDAPEYAPMPSFLHLFDANTLESIDISAGRHPDSTWIAMAHKAGLICPRVMSIRFRGCLAFAPDASALAGVFPALRRLELPRLWSHSVGMDVRPLVGPGLQLEEFTGDAGYLSLPALLSSATTLKRLTIHPCMGDHLESILRRCERVHVCVEVLRFGLEQSEVDRWQSPGEDAHNLVSDVFPSVKDIAVNIS